MRDILVTGGTGFIGSHLVERLARNSPNVKCLVRHTSDTGHLKKIGAELVIGDLLDKASLEKAVKNVDVVYHLAAQVRPGRAISRLSDFKNKYTKVNVEGTENLLDVCLTEGVSKFIYYSSISAMGIGKDLTEEMPCEPLTEYGKSKRESEEYIAWVAKKEKFPVIIVRPGQIYGPRCIGMLTLFKLIKYGVFFTVGDGSNTIPLCYVDDLINGTLLAAEKGKNAEIYFIGGPSCNFRDFATAIADELDCRIHRTYIPRQLFLTGLTFKEWGESIVNVKVCPFRIDLSTGGIKSASHHCSGSIEKARRDLGYEPGVLLKEGIHKTTRWFLENGLL